MSVLLAASISCDVSNVALVARILSGSFALFHLGTGSSALPQNSSGVGGDSRLPGNTDRDLNIEWK